ncbi:hypothetical protein ACHAXR_006993 [Thalassiosira sp. AJA248-18]
MIVSFESPSHDENWSPSALSSIIAKHQSSGEDVKYLIAPISIESNADDASNQSCTAARHSSKQPKNHLKANRQALKEKQRNNKDALVIKQAQEKLRLQKLDQKKQRLYGKVRSRIFHQTDPSLPSPSARTSHPAAASRDSSSPMSSPFSTDSVANENNEHNFHIAFGRKVPVSAPMSRPNSGVESVASSSGRHHRSYGKVPSYITDRKAYVKKEEERERRLEENRPPQPGLVLMEESERLETLKCLEDNEREAKDALRNIPFSMDENKAGRLREAIEFRLKEIEDTRKIFSRDKVFVAQSGD